MIGKTLGPYKIIEQLGAGGMGEVYLGEDTRLGRKVAILAGRHIMRSVRLILPSVVLAGAVAGLSACATKVGPEAAQASVDDISVFAETDVVPDSCERIRESRVEDGGQGPANCFGSREGAIRRAMTVARGSGGSAIHLLALSNPNPTPRGSFDSCQGRSVTVLEFEVLRCGASR